jgi:hypothetical protein
MPAKEKGTRALFENITMVMILLVLFQTLLEDLVIFLNLAVPMIDIVKLSAIVFDLFFTIEFAMRLISAIKQGKGRHYFLHGNGWIDLLASVPLVIFVSGPYLLGHFTSLDNGGTGLLGLFGLLKIVKAIRVARILRLMRVLKIFGSIKNINSKMAQRHVTVISTIFITSLISFIMGQSVLSEFNILPSRLQRSIDKEVEMNAMLHSLNQTQGTGVLDILLDDIGPANPSLLTIYDGDKAIYQNPAYDGERIDFFERRINSDITGRYTLEGSGLEVIHYRLDAIRLAALDNVLNFMMILFILILFIAVYTKHFTKTVTDPIFVMSKGFSSREFISPAVIDENFKDDDVFILADEYNRRWLPAKERTLNRQKSETTKLRRM